MTNCLKPNVAEDIVQEPDATGVWPCSPKHRAHALDVRDPGLVRRLCPGLEMHQHNCCADCPVHDRGLASRKHGAKSRQRPGVPHVRVCLDGDVSGRSSVAQHGGSADGEFRRAVRFGEEGWQSVEPVRGPAPWGSDMSSLVEGLDEIGHKKLVKGRSPRRLYNGQARGGFDFHVICWFGVMKLRARLGSTLLARKPCVDKKGASSGSRAAKPLSDASLALGKCQVALQWVNTALR